MIVSIIKLSTIIGAYSDQFCIEEVFSPFNIFKKRKKNLKTLDFFCMGYTATHLENSFIMDKKYLSHFLPLYLTGLQTFNTNNSSGLLACILSENLKDILFCLIN